MIGGAALAVAVVAGAFAISATGGSNGSRVVVGPPSSGASAEPTVPNAGSGASSGNGSADSTPHVPRNNVVNIYNVFGLNDVDAPILDGITKRLASEGYAVTEYKDLTEGAGSQGGATLANFVGMAQRASVIIINAHGIDFSGEEQACTRGKAITRCTTTIDSPESTSTTALPATTAPPATSH